MSNVQIPCALLFALLLSVLFASSSARAHENGFAVESCDGCHRGGAEPQVDIALSPSSLGLSQTVRLSVSIAARNGSRGGLYFQATPGLGTVKLVSGESTKLSGDNGVVHTAPKAASAGKVTFQIDWTAPSQPGGVEFQVYALSANGDRSSGGDGAGYAYASLAFGCAPLTFYPDRDGDGDGDGAGPLRMACNAPAYFAASKSDCNDNDQRVHPAASESCNGADDDCDGQLDEGLAISTYCEDKDGDGHGVRSPLTAMGCKPGKGFGLCDDDCDDADPGVYPNAQELCNYKDDNCNSRVDDGAKMTCGVGWCRRNSESCSSSLCEPGQPRAEECNAFDDDCDDVIDNGSALCGAGKACVEGVCLVQRDAGVASSFDAGELPAEDEDPAPIASDADEQGGGSAGCSVAHTQRSASLELAALLWLWLARGKRVTRR